MVLLPAPAWQSPSVPEQVFAKASPSVVTVETPYSQGTGFVVASQIIATCRHVVDSSGTATVRFSDGSSMHATVLMRSRSADLALLRPDQPIKVRPLLIDLRSSTLRVGQPVFVIGSPRGLNLTLATGILSGVRPSEMERNSGASLQIQVPISPGSSGSPVLNSEGYVMGVVQGSYENSQELNFAVEAIDLQLLLMRGLDTLPEEARDKYEDLLGPTDLPRLPSHVSAAVAPTTKSKATVHHVSAKKPQKKPAKKRAHRKS